MSLPLLDQDQSEVLCDPAMFELNWKSKREWRWLRVIWMVLWVVLTIFLTWRIKCLVLTCHHLILLYGD
ncbi:hypothetical protein F2Q68_00041792, partial [Brassica cretica]